MLLKDQLVLSKATCSFQQLSMYIAPTLTVRSFRHVKLTETRGGPIFYYFCWFVLSVQEYMASEGIELDTPQGVPNDPYIESRKESAALRTYQTKTTFDKLKQFLELDRQVILKRLMSVTKMLQSCSKGL